MDCPAACLISTRLKQLASEGFLHLLEQIKVTKTHVQRAGCSTVSQCYCVEGSSTGVWQCAVPCSASGRTPVMDASVALSDAGDSPETFSNTLLLQFSHLRPYGGG